MKIEKRPYLDLEEEAFNYVSGMSKKIDLDKSIIDFNTMFTDDRFCLYNDINFLQEIDELNLSTVTKIFYYILYNPIVISKSDLYNFLKNLDLQPILDKNKDTWNSYISILIDIIEEMLIFINNKYYHNKDISIKNMKEENYLLWIMTHFTGIPEEDFRSKEFNLKSNIETLENFYKLGNFLNYGKDTESFNDYYDRIGDIQSLFNEDGMINISLLYEEYFIYDLYDVFSRNYNGTMGGSEIDNDIIEFLKRITKEDYNKIISVPIRNSNNKRMLELSIQYNDMENIYHRDERINILTEILLEKTLKDPNIDIVSLLSIFIYNENDTDKSIFYLRDLFKETLSLNISLNRIVFKESVLNRIVNIIIENKDELSTIDILVFLLIVNIPFLWVYSYFDYEIGLGLLLDLIEKDIRKTINLLKYIVFEYKENLPTSRQWAQVNIEEFLNRNPEDILKDLEKRFHLTKISSINSIDKLRIKTFDDIKETIRNNVKF